MKTLFLVLSLIFCPLAFGQSCNGTVYNVVTGYGYLTNSQGQIFTKAQYPLGTVCIETGITYTEVANQTTLNAIQVYQPPPPPPTTADLIAQDEQALAIADLQSKGVLTDDQATAQTANLTALNTAVTAASATAASVTTGTTGKTQVNGT